MAYHHGNLREALIETALRLIGERGPAGFAFAEVARAAGVSPAAPYRHFRDRNALVAEVARLGFERFADALETAWNQGRPDPVRAIENLGRAYLAFAREEPAFYAVMFEAKVSDEANVLASASQRAFGVLRRGADAACAAHPAEGRPPALMVALHLWAMAHGIASLFVAEGAARRKLPMTPEDLLEAGMLVYLQSLGLAR
ncbi:MAG: TetR/AcrR family transcriptional regulator [Acetobacteraceae bacterium]